MTVATRRKFDFTIDQRKAMEAIIEFVKKRGEMLTIGGLAGTGKTTTLAESIAELRRMTRFKDLKVAFVCFTGKAATVLRDKLETAGAITGQEYCGTIHGLIYRPVLDENDRLIEWRLVDRLDEQLIIIDEASMVSESILADLQSYRIPIIAVGDHGQLPPVMSKLNLMENPMVKLEKIHRQAEGNPIIKWSMLARAGEQIPFGLVEGPGGENVSKTGGSYADVIKGFIDINPMVLCGINRTRVSVNQLMRQLKNFSGDLPMIGEKVICLKNNRRQKIFNGMVGEILSSEIKTNADFYKVHIRFEIGAFEWRGEIFRHQFNREYPLRSWNDWNTKVQYNEQEIANLFDFGYCLTTHKAQGSQAETVIVIEEYYQGQSADTRKRWLYTALTRASRNLIIVAKP